MSVHEAYGFADSSNRPSRAVIFRAYEDLLRGLYERHH